MKKSLPLFFCLLLAGCTDADWDNALNYTGLKGSADEPEAVETPAAAPENNFCRSVAMQDASDNGFDQATQQRVYTRSYAQCVTLGSR